jgi:hypothetical protein
MTDKQIEALQAEIDRLKAQQPTIIDHAAAGRWKDKMHQLSEERALRGAKSFFSREDLAAMKAAAPDDQCKEIALRDCRAPTSPSQAGTSGQVTKTSSNAGLVGSTKGWSTPVPIRNGLNQGR